MTNDAKTTIVFIAFALGSLVPLLAMETEFNAPFYLAFTYLTWPIVILTFVVIFKKPHWFFKKGELKAWKQVLAAVAMSALLTLFSASYLSLVNAFLPPQKRIVIEGTIVRKFKTGKNQSKRVVVLDTVNPTGKPYRFHVAMADYDRLSVGAPYKKTFTRGGLGIIYNWK